MTNLYNVLGFPCGSVGKESTCNAGDLSSIPVLGKFPGEGTSCPLQYSGLEYSMDCIVYGVTKSWKQLSDFHFHFHRMLIAAKYLLSISGCCSKIDSIMTHFMYCIRWRCAILIWLFADGINLQSGTHTPGPSFPQCYISKSFVAFLVFLFIFVLPDLGWRSLTFLISRQ